MALCLLCSYDKVLTDQRLYRLSEMFSVLFLEALLMELKVQGYTEMTRVSVLASATVTKLTLCVCVCALQVKEKPSDLRVVPENEPLDSDTEAERNLMERIKSIKQEK